MKHDSYDQIISNGQPAEELAKNGIFRIHPSFRIVALAEPPSGNKNLFQEIRIFNSLNVHSSNELTLFPYS